MLQKKVTGILMYINRISNCFGQTTRVIVIQSLVLSLIYYCIQIWGSTNNSLMCKAQRLQNFAAKVAVGGARKYNHVSPFFKELKWLRVQEIHSFNICTTMFKALKGFYPEGFLSLTPWARDTETGARSYPGCHPARANCQAYVHSRLYNFLLHQEELLS